MERKGVYSTVDVRKMKMNAEDAERIHLDKCRKEHVLPEYAIPLSKDEKAMLTEEFAMMSHYTYLAYILEYCTYSMLFDLNLKMLRLGKDLKRDTKRRFNEFFEAMKQAEKKAWNVNMDVAASFDYGKQDNFGAFADSFLEFIKDAYDRSIENGDTLHRMHMAVGNYKARSRKSIFREWLTGNRERMVKEGRDVSYVDDMIAALDSGELKL